MPDESSVILKGGLHQPFAGDIFIEERILQLRSEYNIVNAIETGTHMGASFAWFYNHFDNVCSCELNGGYYQMACKILFEDVPQMRQSAYPPRIINPPGMGDLLLSNMDSVLFIKEIIPTLKGESIFFLDAHWYDWCPLEDELLAIADGGLKPAVIAIHDFKTDHPDLLGYDVYKGQPYELDWVSPLLNRIYGPDWTYEYNLPESAAGARRGIVYIKRVPK